MKDIYPLLVNIKREKMKCILCALLFFAYHYVYDYVFDELCKFVGINNICYASRIIMIITVCGGFIYMRICFSRFYKKNWEILILLGFSEYKIGLLFFLTNYTMFFILLYFGALAFQMNNIAIDSIIVVNMLNAMLIGVLVLLLGTVKQSKKIIHIYCLLAGVLGVLIATDNLSYNNAYAFVSSNAVTQILFSESGSAVFIKIVLFIVISILAILRMGNKGIEMEEEERYSNKRAWTKDILWKIYSKIPSIKNYVWIYKNKDFILWKFFSTVVFGLICCNSTNLLFLFMMAYTICLINTFYFKDVYQFERGMFFHYIMSDYSYAKVKSDLFISGFLILGDNLLLILIISCFFRTVNSILVLGISFIIGAMTVFFNNQLFVRYPIKQNYLQLIYSLIRFHIPILNIICFVKDTKNGKINWENMNYE